MKKLLISTVSVISATAIAGMSAFAVNKYTAQDLKNLCTSLLGQTKITAEQDVDGDGRVDVFDMIEMRRSFMSTGEFSEQIVDVSEQNVKYTGRNIYDENNVLWLVQSGSAIEFTVTGKSAEITINGDSFIESDEKYRPRYAVIVDDEIILDELLRVSEKTVELFSGKESRTATVKVIHLSEANNGAVGVSSIKVNSDLPVPVAPTAKKDLQIEFIGDSITCAYGVEGKDQYENFKTSTENFMKSYAYLTAKQLDADYSAVSYSGHGIISGYSQNGDRETDSLVPDYYDYVGKLGSYKVPWDFDSHQKDVVVINLGTNDNTYTSVDYETRGPEFAEEYAKFLNNVHERNPKAYIICTLGTMGCTENFPYIEQAVETFKKESGYDRIMCYQSATHTQADGLGSDWHPSEKTQQNSAYVLADKICQALGMESDQIGIDVASEAEYSVKTTDTARMSDYFSDWDKSYHITTVTGGASKESIQAFVSGIGLRRNGTYRFSFQIETGDGAEIPFCIRNSETGEVIFEDVFSGKGTKSPYEVEFTDETADCNAEIVFSIGGADSSRFSLYELKLVKTA
ncbi:MAG: GDSL-type esterase/lipase family protein [Ruminococcus flavefaciens]|nr:GDSL-type esterase/lipase family protein [Ruminococcus flavefaciens]MCM1229814.1 GDSL-type esterase/lipase family protein [Ruminococcus flavefaciens]